jgi:hypothetical protein
MSLPLPPPIRTYFEIGNGAAGADVTRCFTPDAVLVDEGQTHEGVGAIQKWKREVREKFEYTVEPLSVSSNGNSLKVAAKVIGNFPGSPVQLDHLFELAGDKIKSLEIC